MDTDRVHHLCIARTKVCKAVTLLKHLKEYCATARSCCEYKLEVLRNGSYLALLDVHKIKAVFKTRVSPPADREFTPGGDWYDSIVNSVIIGLGMSLNIHLLSMHTNGKSCKHILNLPQ